MFDLARLYPECVWAQRLRLSSCGLLERRGELGVIWDLSLIQPRYFSAAAVPFVLAGIGVSIDTTTLLDHFAEDSKKLEVVESITLASLGAPEVLLHGIAEVLLLMVGPLHLSFASFSVFGGLLALLVAGCVFIATLALLVDRCLAGGHALEVASWAQVDEVLIVDLLGVVPVTLQVKVSC